MGHKDRPVYLVKYLMLIFKPISQIIVINTNICLVGLRSSEIKKSNKVA